MAGKSMRSGQRGGKKSVHRHTKKCGHRKPRTTRRVRKGRTGRQGRKSRKSRKQRGGGILGWLHTAFSTGTSSSGGSTFKALGSAWGNLVTDPCKTNPSMC
jgi:hypothetical protein